MDDLISRQAAIDTFHAFAPGIPWDALDKIFAEIPSAQPEEVFKIGKPYPLKGYEFCIFKDAYGDDWVEIRKSTVETTLPTGHVYRCDPEKNRDCRKTGCYINGGDCYLTQRAEYAKEERR